MANRKTALLALAVLGAAVGAVALAMPPVPTGPVFRGAGAPDDAPHRGGTFRFYEETDLRGLDPHVQSDVVSLAAMKLLFETLVEHDASLQLVPRLARELPSVEADGREYVFLLRDDVHFHNGRLLEASDVKWSMERMLHPDTNSPGAGFYSSLEGLDAYREGRATSIAGIVIESPTRIRFRLASPDQTFLHALGLLFATPLPREHVEAHPADFPFHPVGTGAFVLESWEHGLYLTFARNPHFYRPGEPYVDRLVFELNLGRNSAFMRFLAGQLDHLHRFAPTDYLWVNARPAWQPFLDRAPILDLYGLEMNCEMAPFDDVHVRRAVAYSIDFEAWNRARAGRLNPLGQPLPQGVLGHDDSLEGHHFDLDRARNEMALAGHPVRCQTDDEGDEHCVAEGLEDEIEIWVGEGPAGQVYGLLLSNDLARIGLRVRLRPASFPLYLSETGKRHTVQALFGGWLMDYPDPAAMLEPLFHSRSATETNSSNRTFYRNAELDALLDRGRSELDQGARAALYRQASGILIEEAPWAFVLNNTGVELHQPYVRGYVPNPIWHQMYRDVWLDLPRERVRP
jgi:ABC-type transport system substrate-binding protein